MHPGENVAIKLDSYPQRTWHGRVSVVSPEAKAGDGDRTFTVEVPLSNARREFARRHDWQGEDFARMETCRLRAAAPSGAVGLADTLELDRVVMGMRSPLRMPDSLVTCGRNFDRGYRLHCWPGCDSHPGGDRRKCRHRAGKRRGRKAAPDPGSAPIAEAPDPKSFTTTGPLVAEQQADVAAERNGRIVEHQRAHRRPRKEGTAPGAAR